MVASLSAGTTRPSGLPWPGWLESMIVGSATGVTPMARSAGDDGRIADRPCRNLR